MKAGEVVMIYEDPMTETKPEGKAKLIRRIGFRELTEYWLVQFVDDTAEIHHGRWIKSKRKQKETTA